MNNYFLLCRECIATADAGEFLFWLALFVALGLMCLYRGYRSFRFKRLVEDMPTSKIRSASQGYTELVGVAEVISRPQTAPLSGEPCVWWRYKVERYQRSRRAGFWVAVDSDASTHPFYLDDGTGQCLIDPEDADINCRHVKTWYGNTRRPLRKPIHYDGSRVVLTTVMSRVSFGNRYRYTEYQIRDGDPLYTLGHFATDSRGQRSVTARELSGDILREWKLDYPSLLARFDSDGNGELDLQEWRQVTQAAREQAEAERRELLSHPQEHAMVKPHGGLPFIIGSHSQVRLISRFYRRALFFSAGFLVTGSLATWLLAARLG